jgi:4-amino-4-deoxy-L-arabinose transferase-like glycosyltransferase
VAALGLILAAALGLRMLWSHNGLPYLHHWDEPRIANNALRMLQTGDFNPHFFNYGSLLIYLNVGVDVLHYLYLAGKPEGHPDALDSLADLQVGGPGGWAWQVSHPTFYLWNRWLTSAFGVGCVFVSYLLARALGGQRAALLAAFAVATVPFHVEQSARVTTDVPSSFFALCAALLSVEFLRRSAPGLLALALACVGAAASVKYNAAVALAAPVAALAYARAGNNSAYRWWLWPCLALVPIVFLLGTPYALLDLPGFLQDAGYEVHHYMARGHGAFTVAPGLPHLRVQLAEILRNWGWGVCLVAAVGMLTIIGTPLGVIAFLLPLLQLWMTSRTTVAFHRNVVLVYPFLAVAFGVGAAWLLERLISRARGERQRTAVKAAVALAVVVFAVHRSTIAFEQAWGIGTMVETRSVAVSRLNRLPRGEDDPAKVVISSELHVHPRDLRRLRLPYEERPLPQIACRPEEGSVVLVPARVSVEGELEGRGRYLNLLLETGGEILATVGRGRNLSLEEYTRNPAVQIRRHWKPLPLSPDQARPCAGTDLAADPAFVAAARPIGNR